MLLWRGGWPRRGKAAATALSMLWVLAAFAALPLGGGGAASAGDPAAGPEGDGGRAAADLAVPDLTGRSLAGARDAAVAAHYAATSHDASDGNAGQGMEGDWTVCFQTPAAGTRAPAGTAIDLAVVREGLPCPAADGAAIPYLEVPEVLGRTFARAAEALEGVGLDRVVAAGAYADVPLPAAYGDWIVCFQDPEPGTEVRDPRTTARLSLVGPGLACPAEEFTMLRPAPEDEGAQEGAPGAGGGSGGDEETAGGSSGTWGASGGSRTGSGGSGGDWASGGSWGSVDSGGPGEGGSWGWDGSGGSWGGEDGGGEEGEVYYRDCDAVRAAGQAPLHWGDPGYRRGLDRDGDGTACEF
ncbi:PASTA domain-containing protein [Streptomyces hoynatensis]|uniref:PASTA domain-containing protein n=1 Tax=Streptomyces hoynatensis TaxID=1141874 RepID=A0A3A9YPP7_9ACTN|nr:PASTA domain-containing protein [Streptomyces hoynatensis]